jgi:hypothetical protein
MVGDGSGYTIGWRNELVLHAPAVVILFFVSSQTGFNHHSRYILHAMPFLYITIGRLFSKHGERGRIIAPISTPASPGCWGPWATSLALPLAPWLAGGIALTWSVASSLAIYPHSLSYFNELAGGPENGHAHLVDSNIDWGQDLLYLKAWIDEHPEARPIRHNCPVQVDSYSRLRASRIPSTLSDLIKHDEPPSNWS